MPDATIFEVALTKAGPAERAAYLDQVCAGNPQQRQQLEELLAAHDSAGHFLERPAVEQMGAPEPAETTTTTRPSIPPGELLTFLEPATRADSLGRLGHYHILGVVGQGGMGTVFKAFDEQLHRIVAIKIISSELAASASARRRFIREARAAAAVAHEHVVTIHAVDGEHRPPFLVMQFVEGCSLQEKLDRQGPPGLREILRIGLQTASGLAAAHKQGLVHRDIKPANILLENGVERVKLTDFGLARIADDASHTQSGIIAGTPQYMSPEQAEGLTVDHRSDLFSLGSVLYVLCTGHAPFRATTTMAVLKRVCEDSPRAIREINPEIPEWLCEIVGQLMAKHPADRYQSAEDVARLLSEHLAHLQGLAPAPGRTLLSPAVLRSQVRGLTARVGLGTLGLLLAVLVICVGPSLLLIVGGRARVEFYGEDAVAVEVFRGETLMGRFAGTNEVELPAGDYELRVQQPPSPKFVELLIDQQWWPWPTRRQRVQQDSTQITVTAGDRVRVWKLLGGVLEKTAPVARGPEISDRTVELPVLKPAVPAPEAQAAAAAELGLAVSYTNSAGMTFRLIPAGEFEMGMTPTEMVDVLAEVTAGNAGPFEKFVAETSGPQRRVTLTRPFYLGQHEVTIAQFRQFVEAADYRTTLESHPSPRWTWKTFAEGRNEQTTPVCGISWDDARAFCRWLTEREYVTCDLPTEAQWEYACRAGSTTFWSFGNDVEQLPAHAIAARSESGPFSTEPARLPNGFGLQDMHGNVDEWCLDWHRRDFYQSGPVVDPVCLQDPADPASGRVARGGAWNAAVWWSHSATRTFDFPKTPAMPKGFRVSIQGDLSRLRATSK